MLFSWKICVKNNSNNRYLTMENSGFNIIERRKSKKMKICLPLFLCGVLIFLSFSCSTPDNPNGEVHLSANTYLFAATRTGEVKRYDINNGNNKPTIEVASNSVFDIMAEGTDSFSLLSLDPKRLEAYSDLDIPDKSNEVSAETEVVSTLEIQNPTSVVKKENYFVVADSTSFDYDPETKDGRILIFEKRTSGFELRNMVLTDFRIAGMEFVNNDLYVIKAHSAEVAVFRNFLESYKVLIRAFPTRTVRIEEAVQLSSLDYENGIMVLSDLGDPSVDGDGKVHVITGFESKFLNTPGDNIIPVVGQSIISGNNTKLGNPVDIKYNAAYNAIFVAEASNGGGRILAFNRGDTAGGNISPDLNYKLSGATSLDFYTE